MLMLMLMSKCALTVVGTEDVKKRALWIINELGEVDIGIMKKIFAAPREGHGQRGVRAWRRGQCCLISALVGRN